MSMAITQRGKWVWEDIKSGLYQAQLTSCYNAFKHYLKGLKQVMAREACAAAIAELQKNGLCEFWSGDINKKYGLQMEQYRSHLVTYAERLYDKVQQDQLSAEEYLQLGAAAYLAMFGARKIPQGDIKGGKEQEILLEGQSSLWFISRTRMCMLSCADTRCCSLLLSVGLYNVMQDELQTASLQDLSDSHDTLGSCADAAEDELEEVNSANTDIGT